jgi:hypothetical protein
MRASRWCHPNPTHWKYPSLPRGGRAVASQQQQKAEGSLRDGSSNSQVETCILDPTGEGHASASPRLLVQEGLDNGHGTEGASPGSRGGIPPPRPFLSCSVCVRESSARRHNPSGWRLADKILQRRRPVFSQIHRQSSQHRSGAVLRTRVRQLHLTF